VRSIDENARVFNLAPPISTQRAPLSWQQETLLRRHNGFAGGELYISFRLPTHLTDEELGHRLDRMVQREVSMRIVDHDDSGVTYADELTTPIYQADCGKPDEVARFIAHSRHEDFPRDDGRLFKWTLIRHLTEDGGAARTLLGLFDHFITDRIGANLIQKEILSGQEGNPRTGAGRYLEWQSRQRSEFPRIPGHATAASEFWRRHLNGTSPTAPMPLPVFTDTSDDDNGKIIILSERVPISPEELDAACRSSRTTPSVFFLATLVSLAARYSGFDDFTIRYMTTGRTPESASTFGWLNTCVPMRFRGQRLPIFANAVDVVRSAWKEVLPYQHTPYGYLSRLFASPGIPVVNEIAQRRQLVVNYFPDAVAGVTDADFDDQLRDFRQDYLALYVVRLASGGFMFRMRGNAADVNPEALRRFLRQLCCEFIGHVRDVAVRLP
jgi:hypothetical protein